MKRLCVIIPIYHSEPLENERISIMRTVEVLSSYDIYAICPEGLDVSKYRELNLHNFLTYSDEYFKSNKSYSRLLLSEMFYSDYKQYEYMLIAQTDTLILNTEFNIEDFMDFNYDYWGAPWPNGVFGGKYGIKEAIKRLFVHNPKGLKVGNGGFSLRRIQSTKELVVLHKKYISLVWRLNEDLFFSNMARKYAGENGERRIIKPGFRYVAAPVSQATLFALETDMKEQIQKGHIPYAVHAWEKYYDGDILKYCK